VTGPVERVPLTDEQLDRWERLAQQATPEPWSAADEHGLLDGADPAWCVSRMQPGYEAMSEIEGYMYDVAYTTGTNEQADAEFIAAAREAVPALAAELRASRAREQELQQRIDGVLAMCEAADTNLQPRLMYVELLDPRTVRAVLTGTETTDA